MQTDNYPRLLNCRQTKTCYGFRLLSEGGTVAFEFPIWLLWVISGSGACLMVYVLIQWRKGWEACRPMPFHRRRRRYARGLLLALILMIVPHYAAMHCPCLNDTDVTCRLAA